MTMAEIGTLCRGFLLGLSKLEVNGLESFTELLDSRWDPTTRTRGLITGKFLLPLKTRIQAHISLSRSIEPYKRVRTYRSTPNAMSTRKYAGKRLINDFRMDDPLMWGVLPLKYHFNLPSYNRRWGFGSHDICFATR